MAKVYADQGKLEKAVEIYQYLLKKEPGRQDLIDAILEIDKAVTNFIRSDEYPTEQWPARSLRSSGTRGR